MGQTGPIAKIAGYGNMAAAISGFHNLTGWPDRPPAGPFGAYTDYISPRFSVMAILAALDYRRRTGEGQYIDQSQSECSLHFLGPAVLDYTVNGRVQVRAGNTDHVFAPHGVYPVAGEDKWIAIVCRTDDDWRRFCAAVGRDELAADSRYASIPSRLEHRETLDAIIFEWSRDLEGPEIEHILQSRGIAAHRVQNSSDAFRDPQFLHREHFVDLNHPTLGTFTLERTARKTLAYPCPS